MVLMDALANERKRLVLVLLKKNFCLSLHYNADNTYLFINGKEIFKVKANNKNINFQTQFYLRSISNGYGATDSREVSLKRNVYGLSVDYDAFDQSDILKNSQVFHD